MEMQTRDPLVHLDHQGYVAQKVNKYVYFALKRAANKFKGLRIITTLWSKIILRILRSMPS